MGQRSREPKSAKSMGATLKKQERKRSFKFDVARLKRVRSINFVPITTAALVCTLAALLAVYWEEVANKLDHEVVRIEVRGQLNYQNPDALQKVLNKHLGEGFFAIDLNGLKAEVEAMPWIYSASLTRRWPGALTITVKEQYPVARWNNEAYLNEYGEMFSPLQAVNVAGVPEFFGPMDHAKDVLKQYVGYRELLATVDENIAALSLESRGAWRLTLKNGIEIKLGRAPLDEKLNRFLRAYKQGLSSKADEIQSIDARYTNGIAVRWKSVKEGEGESSGST